MAFYKKKYSAYSTKHLSTSNEYCKLQEENAEMREEIENLKSELYEKNKLLKEKNSQIELLSEKVGDLSGTLMDLEEDNDGKSMMIDHLNVTIYAKRFRTSLTEGRRKNSEKKLMTTKVSYFNAKQENVQLKQEAIKRQQEWVMRQQEWLMRQQELEKRVDELNEYAGYLEDKLSGVLSSDVEALNPSEGFPTVEVDPMTHKSCDSLENEDSGCESTKTGSVSTISTDTECEFGVETIETPKVDGEVMAATSSECEKENVIDSAKDLKTDENRSSKKFKNSAKNQKKRKYRKMYNVGSI